MYKKQLKFKANQMVPMLTQLNKLGDQMLTSRGSMIQELREFKHERNRMDTIIADERRSMFTMQHEMSKQVERID
jgi:hypothetical protein